MSSNKNKCNSSEGGKGDTTPVGAYSPTGDSPYGVADMAGNVWEWCHSLHKPYPYQLDDGRENEKDNSLRVVRGGSWLDDLCLARCAYRDWFAAVEFVAPFGFRVVVSAGLG